MRFTTIVISAVMAAVSVNAQNATATPAVSGTQSVTPVQASQAACLAKCSTTDVGCRNTCITVPVGDYAQQNATVGCVTACPKGNGTAEDDLNYQNCLKGCLVSATITPSTSAATATGSGSGSSATGSGSGSGSTSGSGGVKTSGSGASATGSSSSTSTSKAAAAETLRVGMTVGGIVGAFAAVMAL